MRGVATAAAVLLVAAGCGRDRVLMRWTDNAQDAERLLETGKYDSARDAFAKLEGSAQSKADAAYTWLRRAEAHRRQGRFGKAEVILWRLLRSARQEGLDVELRSKIAYKLGRVIIDRGDRDRGERHLNKVLDFFPDTTFALRAFFYLRGVYRERDKAAFVRWCRARYQRQRDTLLGDNYMYEAARVYYERNTAGDDVKAARLYQTIRDRWGFRTSPLWDDALWELSLIHHRRGRFREELDVLRQLLSTREGTWLGSYEIRNYKHAHFRMARVHYEDLKDYLGAAQLFASFREDFPYSRMHDDSLWWEAHALRKAGKAKEAKARFAQLLAKYPESKYARRVREGKPGP